MWGQRRREGGKELSCPLLPSPHPEPPPWQPDLGPLPPGRWGLCERFSSLGTSSDGTFAVGGLEALSLCGCLLLPRATPAPAGSLVPEDTGDCLRKGPSRACFSGRAGLSRARQGGAAGGSQGSNNGRSLVCSRRRHRSIAECSPPKGCGHALPGTLLRATVQEGGPG